MRGKYENGSLRSGLEGMDWIDLVQDRGRWRAVVKAVMNLRVIKMWAISLVVEELVDSQERLCSMELVGYLVS